MLRKGSDCKTASLYRSCIKDMYVMNDFYKLAQLGFFSINIHTTKVLMYIISQLVSIVALKLYSWHLMKKMYITHRFYGYGHGTCLPLSFIISVVSSGCWCQGGNKCSQPRLALLWLCYNGICRWNYQVHPAPSSYRTAWQDDFCWACKGIFISGCLHENFVFVVASGFQWSVLFCFVVGFFLRFSIYLIPVVLCLILTTILTADLNNSVR